MIFKLREFTKNNLSAWLQIFHLAALYFSHIARYASKNTLCLMKNLLRSSDSLFISSSLKWSELVLFFVFPILLMQSLTACSSSKTVTADSLPSVTRAYNGYRIVVADIAVKKKKSKSVQLQYNLINTGRETIFHKKGKTTTPPIYFEFDKTLKEAELLAYKNDILQQVLNNDLTLKAGQSLKKQTMKLRLDPKRKVVEEEDGTFTISVGDSNTQGKDYIDRNFCPDLRLDTLIITRQTKKWATIEYRISNHGKGPAAFKTGSGKEEKQLAIKAFLNRTGKLSKGSIPIGGSFISDKDLLKPGEIYTGVVRLDITKKTKYSSMLIIQLDPYLMVRECDETNNKKAVSLSN